MGHSAAIIGMAGKKYIVSTPRTSLYSSDRESSSFDSFADAYMCACKWVKWDYQYISIRIYPKEIYETIRLTKEEHQKLVGIEAEEKEKSELARLKKKFEPQENG